MNVYIAPPYVWVIFAMILIYMGAFIYLWSYLKRAHNQFWLSLGSPSFLNNSIANSHRSMKFLFGSSYKSLNDDHVTGLIWFLRIMLVVVLLMILIGEVFGFIPSRRSSYS